jgi:hypothetical protein
MGPPGKVEADIRAAMGPLKFYPPCRTMLVAANGNVWLEAGGRSSDGSRVWTVLDTNGDTVARVLLPKLFTLGGVRDDVLVGHTVNAYDEQFVTAYRIVR